MAKKDRVETTKVLTLLTAQVQAAVQDANRQALQLACTLPIISEHMRLIQEKQPDAVKPKARTKGVAETWANEMMKEESVVLEMVQQAVVAMQFYDRLTQKLDHTCQTIERLGKLHQNAKVSPLQWEEFYQTTRGSYTTEEEKVVFDDIMAGKSILEALEQLAIYRQSEDNSVLPEGEIELF